MFTSENPFRAVGRGRIEKPHIAYGNGVEIETTVWVKASEINLTPADMNVVKIHFLPQTMAGELISHPREVPDAERSKIKRDALEGFLLLAQNLQAKSISITNQSPDDDFFLCANTNIGFALFLKQHCGFQGEWRTGQVYCKVSDFTSADNQNKMQLGLQSLAK